MSYEAVIFDLFGTLVGEYTAWDRDRMFNGMASILGVPQDDLFREWRATSIDGQTGRIPSVEDRVRLVCGRLGADPSEAQVAEAVAVRLAVTRPLFVARDGAVGVLELLKLGGYRTGLVSACPQETPVLWQGSGLASYIDVAIFSCEVGLMKPDPRIYELTSKRLGVVPDLCLYVGDGGYGELGGAASAGMHSVLLRDPNEQDVVRPDVEAWDGPSITSLREVLALLQA